MSEVKNMNKNMNKNMSKNMSKNISKNMSKNVSKNISKNISKNMSEIKNIKCFSCKILCVMPLFLLLLFGCSEEIEVTDTWAGIDEIGVYADDSKVLNDTTLQTSNATFRLDSDFSIPSIGPDVTYSITSNCHRRERKDDEPEYEKKTYSKTVKYSARDHVPSSLPVANHLNELVLIYPTFFEKCDFRVKAKNFFGSTDSSELKEVLFEYTKEEDHLLHLDDSEVENPLLREGLYESHSKLKALFYKDSVELSTVLGPSNSSSKQRLPHGDTILHKRVSEAQLVCYTNKISKLNLNAPISTNNSDIETISFFKIAEKLHPITPDKPLENCIFTAIDLANGKLITSKAFDLIRNYKIFNASLEYGDIELLPELTSNQIPFLISSTDTKNNVLPDLPNNLLRVRYTNHSNEAKTFYFESLDQIAKNSVFLLKRTEADYRPDNKKIFVEVPHPAKIKFYYYAYTGFNKTSVNTRFYWSTTHFDRLKNHNDNNLLIIPPKSTGFLTLSAVFDESKLLIDKNISSYHGLLIAPHVSEKFVNLSLVSPNEFKWNSIQKTDISEILYPSQRFSALPNKLKGHNNSILIADHIFHILYVNKHYHESGFFEARYSKIVNNTKIRSEFLRQNSKLLKR